MAFKVLIYGIVDEVFAKDEEEVDEIIDKEDRLYGRMCRVINCECDDKFDEDRG